MEKYLIHHNRFKKPLEPKDLSKYLPVDGRIIEFPHTCYNIIISLKIMQKNTTQKN